jgi:hypothetical protein
MDDREIDEAGHVAQPEPTRVFSRSGDEAGEVRISRERRCHLDGCRGVRLLVFWPDGKHTWPCTKGMRIREGDGQWQIL